MVTSISSIVICTVSIVTPLSSIVGYCFHAMITPLSPIVLFPRLHYSPPLYGLHGNTPLPHYTISMVIPLSPIVLPSDEGFYPEIWEAGIRKGIKFRFLFRKYWPYKRSKNEFYAKNTGLRPYKAFHFTRKPVEKKDIGVRIKRTTLTHFECQPSTFDHLIYLLPSTPSSSPNITHPD